MARLRLSHAHVHTVRLEAQISCHLFDRLGFTLLFEPSQSGEKTHLPLLFTLNIYTIAPGESFQMCVGKR